MYIGNAFSLSMLEPAEGPVTLRVEPLSDPREVIKQADEVVSCVGHEDTAAVFSSVLGREIKPNRVAISLKPGEKLLVGQLTGGRLPVGTTTLPEGFRLQWFLVSY